MRNGHFFTTILLLALTGLVGCGDEVTDLDAFVESAEAEAILQSARSLPLLPDLMDRVDGASERDEAVLIRARELWSAGSLRGRRAETSRRLAAGQALPVLEASLADEEWDEVRLGMDGWMTTASAMLQRLHMEPVEQRIEAARRYLARSDAARDDLSRGRYYLLLAMAELVETTPRYVARSMVEDAGTALARAQPAAAANPRQVERATRLKDWAEQAVDEGDYLLAIQRAYYAIQLVEGR